MTNSEEQKVVTIQVSFLVFCLATALHSDILGTILKHVRSNDRTFNRKKHTQNPRN